MTPIKGIEIMMQVKAEYFNAFKDMSENLFKTKIENFNKALEEYSDEEVDVALTMVLSANKSVPGIAHFIEVLERNRELLLSSVEEEWNTLARAVQRTLMNRSIYNIDERCAENQKEYDALSEDVKDYYVNYSGFLDLLDAKLDIERSRFMKNFPIFRKEKKIREKLKTQLKG